MHSVMVLHANSTHEHCKPQIVNGFNVIVLYNDEDIKKVLMREIKIVMDHHGNSRFSHNSLLKKKTKIAGKKKELQFAAVFARLKLQKISQSINLRLEASCDLLGCNF